MASCGARHGRRRPRPAPRAGPRTATERNGPGRRRGGGARRRRRPGPGPVCGGPGDPGSIRRSACERRGQRVELERAARPDVEPPGHPASPPSRRRAVAALDPRSPVRGGLTQSQPAARYRGRGGGPRGARRARRAPPPRSAHAAPGEGGLGAARPRRLRPGADPHPGAGGPRGRALRRPGRRRPGDLRPARRARAGLETASPRGRPRRARAPVPARVRARNTRGPRRLVGYRPARGRLGLDGDRRRAPGGHDPGRSDVVPGDRPERHRRRPLARSGPPAAGVRYVAARVRGPDAVVPARYARRVNAGGGMVRPTLLTDDGVVGTWSLRRERDRTPRIEVDPFGRLAPGVREGLDREVRSIARFMGSRGCSSGPNGLVLAQWSGECEVPAAMFVPPGQQPIDVTAERRLSHVPESRALGWDDRGRAIVDLREGVCGTSFGRPGISAFTGPGNGELVVGDRHLDEPGCGATRLIGAARLDARRYDAE